MTRKRLGSLGGRARWPARVPAGVAIGAGLVALDVIATSDPQQSPLVQTGGTCANVMAILSYLGWHTIPVARLGFDAASRFVARDLRMFSVDVRFLNLPPRRPVPVVIERLRSRRGQNVHTFSFVCSRCGHRLPDFYPITRTTVAAIEELPPAQVFFTDRVSPGILALAQRCREAGATIVYEPVSLARRVFVERMLRMAHIVKYSRAQLPAGVHVPSSVLLHVETAGGNGLRYRSRIAKHRRTWTSLPAFRVEHVRDAAGSGDWCTAGLIHMLAGRGADALRRVPPHDVGRAMRFAQALGAWNCHYIGARGGMYAMAPARFRAAIAQILRARNHSAAGRPAAPDGPRRILLCPSCQEVCV